jgi:hypothetical protein
MAGVDLRTVQTLGDWNTLAMVERDSHLADEYKRDAIESFPTSFTTTLKTG